MINDRSKTPAPPASPLPFVPDSIQTERLHIRAPRAGDGAAMNAAILETWEDLRLWMPWARVRPTVEESEANARLAVEAFQDRSDLRYHMFLKGTTTLVGATGLHRMDWSVPKFEIGYWCRTPFQGQGYVTEAVRGLTEMVIRCLGAQRVEIRCDARNVRSRRVAERAGFRLEGTLRNDDRAVDGTLRDTLVFGCIPEDREAPGESGA